MNDLISRQKAIDVIETKKVNEFGNYREYNVAFNDGLRAAVIVLEDLPSAQPKPITVNIDHELTPYEYEKLRKDMANAPIMLLPSAQKWIPCSERLPEDVEIGEEYPIVIFCTKDNTYCGFYENEYRNWWTAPEDTRVDISDVIAWMPLPEPYREETNNEM